MTQPHTQRSGAVAEHRRTCQLKSCCKKETQWSTLDAEFQQGRKGGWSNAQDELHSPCQVKRRKGEDAEEAEEEERALSTIANLFQGLSRGSRRDRLAAKFVESEFEKCDRLMELYSRYHRRIQAAEVGQLPARKPSQQLIARCTLHGP